MKVIRSVMNLMIFVLLLGLSGCGGDAGSTGQEQPQSEVPEGEEPQIEVPGEGQVDDSLYPDAPSIRLTTEETGSVNTDGSSYFGSPSTYKFSLTAAGTYTVYIEMLEGTTDDTAETSLHVFDAEGIELLNLYKDFGLNKAGDWARGTFDALAAGDYYIRIEREWDEPGYYKFSVHPSLANGLVQDSTGERNDEQSMATPITFEEAMEGIDGSLSITDITDSDDWYELPLPDAGTYIAYLDVDNLEEATQVDTVVQVYTQDSTEIPLSQFNYLRRNGFEKENTWNRYTFDVQAAEKYYVRITHTKDIQINYTLHIQPSIANGLVQDENNEPNDEKAMATPIKTFPEVSAEINGSLNVTAPTDSDDWYRFPLDKAGTYTVYIEMLPGTLDGIGAEIGTNVYDAEGNELLNIFKADNLDQPGEWARMTFDAPAAGNYYIQIENKSSLAAYYKFSIQLSVANGLVQDADHERNDERSMAAPITLAEASAEINGSLSVTAVTDSDDWYKLSLTAAGTYMLYAETLAGTEVYTYAGTAFSMYVENGTALEELFIDNYLQKEGDWSTRLIEVQTAGTYYIRISRLFNRTSYYRFSVQPSTSNGLVHDADHEPNDDIPMQAPITLTEATAGINGTLNITRESDIYDWYQLPLTAGDYTLTVEMLDSTVDSEGNGTNVSIYADGSYIDGITDQNALDTTGDISSIVFTAPLDGDYAIGMTRVTNSIDHIYLPTSYKFSVTPFSSKGKP